MGIPRTQMPMPRRLAYPHGFPVPCFLKYALNECDRLGMTMGLQICDGFSQTGGPWVKPEQGMRSLRCTRMPMRGGETLTCEVPDGTVLVLAYPVEAVLPVTATTGKGRKRTSDATALAITPRSPYLAGRKGETTDAVAKEQVIDVTGQLLDGRRLMWQPPEGNWVVLAFHHVLHKATNHPASPEGHGLECNKLDSDCVDVVYDQVVGPLIEDAGELAGHTLQHVLIDSWECGYQSWTSGFIEEFKARRGYDPTLYLGKQIIKDEAFTVGAGQGDFHFVPAQMKSSADFILCRGTNRFVLHTSTHQPDNSKPGWTHGWNGVNFHRGNTWWPYAEGFISYLARCSYMLQQGVFVADVCRYVGQEDTYSKGYGELPVDGLPEGYRADHCDNTVLLERMDVKGGRIVLPDGVSYAVLLLADKKTMAPAVLRKLATLVEKGATVIGPKPEHAPGLTDYPRSDEEVKRLADRLWGSGSIRDVPLAEILTMGPDFFYTATPASSKINFIHRRLPDADIYFIATAGDGCIADCAFRVTGKHPQVYDPMTGEVYDVQAYDDDGGRTRMTVEIEGQGSRIIVFGEKPVGRVRPDLVVSKSILLSGPWDVSFEPGRGAPASITLRKLMSWTENPNVGVRHFSGVGTYTTIFTVPEDGIKEAAQLLLDLGDVRDLADVTVNGQPAGILWRPPHILDIKPHVRPGLNRLEVRVVNTWVNRLIGDKKVPEDQRVCEIVSPDPKWYDATSDLPPSGLLGPVHVRASSEAPSGRR